jgi:hypothetical protein
VTLTMIIRRRAGRDDVERGNCRGVEVVLATGEKEESTGSWRSEPTRGG